MDIDNGKCGIIAQFATSDLQLRCQYELGHSGPCSWKKYQLTIQSHCGPSAEQIAEREFINSVLFHK